MIEEALGREIVRVSTDDVDVMEEVSAPPSTSVLMMADHLSIHLDSEEAAEMKSFCYALILTFCLYVICRRAAR